MRTMPQPSRTYRYLAQVTSPSDPSDGFPGASNPDGFDWPRRFRARAFPCRIRPTLDTACRPAVGRSRPQESSGPNRVVGGPRAGLGSNRPSGTEHGYAAVTAAIIDPAGSLSRVVRICPDAARRREAHSEFPLAVSARVDARYRIARCSLRAAPKPDSSPETRRPQGWG